MGKKKYNASENTDEWCPIVNQTNTKNNCKYFVLSKVIAGCIYEYYVEKWKKNKFINSCKECKYYEEKTAEEKIKKNKTK